MSTGEYEVRTTGGASMDGTTDDTSAISAGLTAIGNAPGTLLFDGGVCYINGTVTIQPNVKLKFTDATLSLGSSAALTIRSNQAVNVKWFGAHGSTWSTTGSITTGTAALTVASAALLHEGTMVRVEGAGSGGADLYARAITISGTAVTLDTNASTTVSSNAVDGADNYAFEQALDCHPGDSWFYELEVPKGDYRFWNVVNVPNYTTISGGGRLTTRITQDADASSSVAILSMGGGCHVKNMMLIARASGNCITNSGTINDNIYENLWLYGNFATTALMDGTQHVITIDNCVFEAAERAIDLAGNNHLTMSNCKFFDITVSGIRSTSGGEGINLNNIQFIVDSVDASDERIIDLDGYEAINISNFHVKRNATSDFETGFRFLSCKQINLSNVNFHDGISGASGYAVRIDTCQSVRGGINIWGENVQPNEAVIIDDTTDFDLRIQANGVAESFVSTLGTCSNGRIHIIGRNSDDYGILLAGILEDITISGIIEDTGNVTAGSPCIQMNATGRVILDGMRLKRATGKSTNWFECSTAGELRFRRTELVYE